MPRRPTSLVALLAVAAMLAAPAASHAQSPFLPLPQGAQPTVQQQVVTTSSSSGGGLKTWQEVLIFAAGLVLIAGIATAIMADARRRAPAASRSAVADDPLRKAELAHQRRRAKQAARRRQKLARSQRKRNR